MTEKKKPLRCVGNICVDDHNEIVIEITKENCDPAMAKKLIKRMATENTTSRYKFSKDLLDDEDDDNDE